MSKQLSGNNPTSFVTALSMVIMLASCSSGSGIRDYIGPCAGESGQKGGGGQNLYPEITKEIFWGKADTGMPGILPEFYMENGLEGEEIRPSVFFASAGRFAEKTGNADGNLPESPEDEDRAYLPADADGDESDADAGDPFYEEFSRISGLDMDGTEDRELISVIEKWLGTPYRMGGCSESGIDCSCLVRTIYEDVYGITLARTSRNIFKELTRVKKEELREGDIICFRNRKKRISHVGLYLKDGNFIHASRKNGVTISNLRQKYYRKRFAGAGRMRSAHPVELSNMTSSHPTSRQ